MKRALEHGAPSKLLLIVALASSFALAASPSAADDLSGVVGGTGIGVSPSSGSANAGALATAGVEASSGAATATITFQTPPVAGGLSSTLQLQYNSSKGVGAAGVGWGFDLPTIRRRNLSGPPGYGGQPPQDTDRFVFQESPLVPICVVGSDCPANDQFPTGDGGYGGYTYYRLQSDSMYARFFRHPANTQWIIELKTGEVLVLGSPLYSVGSQLDHGGVDWDTFATNTDGVTTNPAYRWNLVQHFDSAYPRGVVEYWWTHDVNGVGLLTKVNDGIGSQVTRLEYESPSYPATQQTSTSNLRNGRVEPAELDPRVGGRESPSDLPARA